MSFEGFDSHSNVGFFSQREELGDVRLELCRAFFGLGLLIYQGADLNVKYNLCGQLQRLEWKLPWVPLENGTDVLVRSDYEFRMAILRFRQFRH